MVWGRIQLWPQGVALATATGGVGGMWLPWFQSGSADRNSFAAFRAAQILGIEAVTPYRVVWFLLPVVLVAAAAVWGLGLPRSAAAILAGLGLVLLLGGAGAVISIGPDTGSSATALGGLCTTLLAVFGRGARAQTE